ncbi:MAG: amino acid ABC transporter [Firmicutes bacterium HGW-Firmicutes-1]|jgi:polar amino acid transport system substrate-binding protein|nr:MAG: amino acid ABC transporter [Firmicutes bacterium HGW-Firmicutes-1]
MRKILALILAMALVFSLSACSKDAEKDDVAENDTVAEDTVKSNVLRVGVDDTYPPMEFRNESNELIGFDVDFAKALATELGMEIEFVPIAWDGIFLGLGADKYDCIISSTSITTERMENYGFSKPYLSNGQVIVVTPGNETIKSTEDLAGKNVGVQIETTADIAAEKQNALTPFELTKYDTIMDTFLDLEAGRLDCVVVDYAVALEYATQNPEGYLITTAQLTNEPIAVCMNKEDTELIEKVNTGITSLQEAGKMKELSNTWFGDDYTSNIDEELR